MIGLGIFGIALGQLIALVTRQPDFERAHYRSGDFILDGKHILDLPLVGFGPKMKATFHVNKLCRYTEFIPCLPETSLKDSVDAELLTDFANILCLSFEHKGGSASRHAQSFEFGESVDELFGHPIAEKFILFISTHVDKGQDGNGFYCIRSGPDNNNLPDD